VPQLARAPCDSEAAARMPEEEESSGQEESEEEEVGEEAEAPAPKQSARPPAEEPAKAAAPAPGPPEFKPHDSYPPMATAEMVPYCEICGLPPDFCQYGPSWDKCKPVCMEKYPQYYPELTGASLEAAKKTAEEAAEKGKEKLLPGGKKKRETSPHVTIRKLTRGGRKCVTCVAGLEGFGLKLDDVAKKFKKKFSCGCSVVKGDNGAPDTVDIQGDFEEEVIDVICEEFKTVPRQKVAVLDGGTKKKGKGK